MTLHSSAAIKVSGMGPAKKTFASKMTPLLALVVFALALLLVSTTQAPNASAQVSCADQALGWSVSTAAELNAAITCHNNALGGQSTIDLLNDISAESVAGDAVFVEITRGDLVLSGVGNTIRRGANAGTQPAPLLAVAGHQGIVDIFDLRVEVGPFETAGIQKQGDGLFSVVTSTIQPGPQGSGATGISLPASVGLADFRMQWSSIDRLPIGIDSAQDQVWIDASTITSLEADVVARGRSTLISNSTLGGPTGIQFGDGNGVEVKNSTIVGDGAQALPGAGELDFVSFESSIVNVCSVDEFATPTQPGPGWGDLGNNAGACFDYSTTVPLVLADNGCNDRPPSGCALTAAIDANSPAFGAGICGSGALSSIDQRGLLRTPIGLGCDAGAYEYGCAPAGQMTFEVATELDFNAAIDCLNSPSQGVRQLHIELQSDIESTTVTPSGFLGDSVFPPISTDAFAVFSINGNGHSLSRSAAAPTPPADLLIINSANNDLIVNFGNLGLVVGPADTRAIQREGFGTLSLSAVSITPSAGGTSAAGISVGQNISDLIVTQSMIDGLPNAIQSSSLGNVLIRESSFVAAQIALFLGDGTADIVNSTLVAPNAIWIELASVDLIATTVVGSLAGNPDFEIPMVARSTIATSCSAPITDQGSNLGGCFGSGPVDTTPADNGCVRSTPAGCPRSIELSPGAAAIAGGDCSDHEGLDIETDQRGFSRAPVVACDVGAFESQTQDLGDVTDNGVVDNADAQAMLVWLAGGDPPPGLAAGDLTNDGEFKLDDALAIAQLVAG